MDVGHRFGQCDCGHHQCLSGLSAWPTAHLDEHGERRVAPKRFGSIHPRFKTPAFSTVVTGIVVALPILFLNQAVVTDLCSIGTLFAFMLVSAGVLVLEKDPARLEHAKFRVPYFNGQYAVPIFFALYLIGLWWLPESHGIHRIDFDKDLLLHLERKFPIWRLLWSLP